MHTFVRASALYPLQMDSGKGSGTKNKGAVTPDLPSASPERPLSGTQDQNATEGIVSEAEGNAEQIGSEADETGSEANGRDNGAAAVAFLVALKGAIEDEFNPVEGIADKLDGFAEAVKAEGPQTRALVLQHGAYAAVIKTWGLFCFSGISTVPLQTPSAALIRELSLKALYSLTAGFPEIIEENGWRVIQQGLDFRQSEATQINACKTLRNICIKSEANREMFTWELNLLSPLIAIIKRDNNSARLVREWCGAVKCLILSDDTRVAYNRAPERKRMIFQQDTLPLLAQHLQTYKDDEGTLNSIVVLLGSMAVNENMCISIETGNVFPAIAHILKAYTGNQMLMKNTMSLTRYLNVSQTVRDKCAGYGLVKVVLQLMVLHKDFPDVVDVGMSCLGFMTLRNACQAVQFVIADGVRTSMELANFYPQDAQIMKGFCLTLRNVAASGGKNGRQKILDGGGEAFLRSIQRTLPDLTENHVKPALRDLELSDKDEAVVDDASASMLNRLSGTGGSASISKPTTSEVSETS